VTDDASTVTFTSSSFRRTKAIVCVGLLGFDVLLLFEMQRDATSLTRIYQVIVGTLGLVCILFIVRALRVGIELTDDGIVARSVISTKRFSWGELADVRARDRTILRPGRAFVPQTAQVRERIQVVPQLRLTSGRLVLLHGLKISIPSNVTSNWVDDALGEINRRLAAWQRAQAGGATGPTPS